MKKAPNIPGVARFNEHPFNFLHKGDFVRTERDAMDAITQIERCAADIIYFNEPRPASAESLGKIFMPYHQNGTFMIGERFNTTISTKTLQDNIAAAPYGFVRDLPNKGFAATSQDYNRLACPPPYIRGEKAGFELWARMTTQQDINIITYEQTLPKQLYGNPEHTPEVVATALQYTSSQGRLCDIIPNQNYIDYIRRAIGLYLAHNPDQLFYTEKSYNDVIVMIAMSIILRDLQEKSGSRPTEGRLKKLMVYSILAGVIGLDMKCSHCATSEINRENGSFCGGKSDEATTVTIGDWLKTKISNNTLFCPELFVWDKYRDLVLSRPCTEVFFPDDLGETLFDMFRIQEEMTYNNQLNVIIVPRSGRYHNDAAFEDMKWILQKPCFSELARFLDHGRLIINDKGPRGGALEGPKLSQDIVDVLLEKADVVFIKGSRSYELIATGMRIPTFAAQTVSREFSESVIGADAQKGIPSLTYFHIFPDFWGFKQRHLRQDPLFPTGRRNWQASMTAIESAKFRESTEFNNLVTKSSLEEVSLSIMEKAEKQNIPPHKVIS